MYGGIKNIGNHHNTLFGKKIHFFLDETITYLSYQWQDYDNDEDNNFVYLVVGTQKRDDYKIYMYDLEAGMPKNLVKSFGGQGKVKMCVYMSSAVYSGIIRKQNNSLPN